MKLIRLSQRQYAKVDDNMYDFLNKWKWYAIKLRRKDGAPKWYAVRSENKKRILMHRVIMGLADNDSRMVDHIDGEGLNDWMANLRVCTNAENQHNQNVKPLGRKTSRYKGVSWRDRDQCWYASIMFNNKSINLGTYDDESDAGAAYDAKARELFGQFACVNFDPPRPVGPRHELKKTSKYTGVYFDARRQKWQAAIFVNGKRKWLGRFPPTDEGEALAANAVNDAVNDGDTL